MNDSQIRYSIVRLIADTVREITVPVGIVAEYGKVREHRFLTELTPALRALAHPADRDSTLRFSRQVAGLLSTLTDVTLDDLVTEGIGGFIFSEPRELLGGQHTLRDEVDYLFKQFVA